MNQTVTDFWNDFTAVSWGMEAVTALTTFILFIFGVWLLVTVLIRILSSVAKATESRLPQLISEEIDRFPLGVFILAGIYLALNQTSLMEYWPSVFNTFKLIIIILFGYFLVRSVNRVLHRFTITSTRAIKDNSVTTSFRYISLIIRFAVWVLAVVVILANIGIDVSALVTALGISGFALAFAFRNLIKDVLGSFLIIFDKPIEVGDYIKTDKLFGRVYKVGLKSTRLKSLDKKIIVLPNTQIVDKPLTNFKQFKAVPVTITAKIEAKKNQKPEKINEHLTAGMQEHSKLIRQKSLKIMLTELTTEDYTFQINYLLTPPVKQGADQVATHIMSDINTFLKKKRVNISKLSQESAELM